MRAIFWPKKRQLNRSFWTRNSFPLIFSVRKNDVGCPNPAARSAISKMENMNRGPKSIAMMRKIQRRAFEPAFANGFIGRRGAVGCLFRDDIKCGLLETRLWRKGRLENEILPSHISVGAVRQPKCCSWFTAKLTAVQTPSRSEIREYLIFHFRNGEDLRRNSLFTKHIAGKMPKRIIRSQKLIISVHHVVLSLEFSILR